MRNTLPLVVAALATTAITVVPTPAAALPDPSLLSRQATTATELRQQIELQLRTVPGGTQTAPNQVSYDGGQFVITFALPGTRAAGTADCPSGWFCFYDGVDFGYPRGQLQDRGWQDLRTWRWHDRTESVHNRTNSEVEYDGHFDFGDPANQHVYDEMLWENMPGVAIRRVHPLNSADHVYRYRV